MPSIYEIIITLVALVICTFTDIKKREINPLIPVLLIAAGFLTPNKNLVENIMCFMIGFAPIFLVNRVGNGGDGDALMCGAMGFSMPLNFGAMVFLITCILYIVVLLPAVLITKNKKLQLPYIPFLLFTYIIVLIIHISGGVLA